MTRTDLETRVAQRLGCDRAQAHAAVDALLAEIAAGLRRDSEVSIRGFGAFVVRSRQARRLVHPRTAEAMLLPAHRTILFRPGDVLLRALAEPDSGPSDSVAD